MYGSPIFAKCQSTFEHIKNTFIVQTNVDSSEGAYLENFP